jgi:hypothetical protein
MIRRRLRGTHRPPSNRGDRIALRSDGPPPRRPGGFLVPLGLTASALPPLGTRVQAMVVRGTPTWPIRSDVALALPPIPTLPRSTAETPPGWAIADPVTSGASCGVRYQQDRYGNRRWEG